jgi:hypothetical protein
MNETKKIDVSKMPHRRNAHPFDRTVPYEEPTRGHDPSPEAIDGYYGTAWDEIFRDHMTGQLFAVTCYDGVNRSKNAHSVRDEEWMEAMRKRIIHRTRDQRSAPILISKREWAIMLRFTFTGWLDSLPGEGFTASCDPNRLIDEGQIGTINKAPVIVDPTYQDNLPKVGHLGSSVNDDRLSLTRPRTSTQPEPDRKFNGVFAAAFQKAGVRT